MARPDRYWLRGLFLPVAAYIAGVWLIIFGFSGALRYARERGWRDQCRHLRH